MIGGTAASRAILSSESRCSIVGPNVVPVGLPFADFNNESGRLSCRNWRNSEELANIEMATPITTLELRSIEIPRSLLIEIFERHLGRSLTHEYRHYLAGEPVHCGTILQWFNDGEWLTGRYEWSGRPADRPTLHIGGQVIDLTERCLLRWPKWGEIS